MSTTETATLPVVTDTRLADLHGQAHEIQGRINRAASTIKQYAGAKRTRHGSYDMSLPDAEAIITAPDFKPANPVAAWGRRFGSVDQAREAIAAARVELAAVDAEIAECEQIWHDNGRWNRFFIVPAGHIHSTMDCRSCNNGHEPTTFGWLPQLSGLTEADAVEAHGSLLCTVCYPSAPVEWTNGLDVAAAAKRATECPGSRQYVQTASWQDRYAKCPECGTTQSRTTTGKLRAHKPPAPPKPKAKKAPAAPAPAPVDPAWDAMQSPELDDALRAFHALDIDLGTLREGPAFEAAKAAFRAMQALAPAGWNSYRRANELGLNHR